MLQQGIFNDLQLNIKNYKQLSGGDINTVYYIEAQEGEFFIKVNDLKNYPDMFKKEAKGLKILAETQIIYTPKVIKIVETQGCQIIVMEWIEEGDVNNNFWIEFGSSLAKMHKIEQPYFGFEEDNYIGSLQQINTLTSTWGELYGQYHILPLVEILLKQQKIKNTDIRKVDSFIFKIDEIFPKEQPSLVHGDLWAGNYLVLPEKSPVLIDPAVYYGHREMDIAMTKLFGGFSILFYQSYNEVYPLEKEWEKRLPYAQLYPLIVHAVLFGGNYVNSVHKILNKF